MNENKNWEIIVTKIIENNKICFKVNKKINNIEIKTENFNSKNKAKEFALRLLS